MVLSIFSSPIALSGHRAASEVSIQPHEFSDRCDAAVSIAHNFSDLPTTLDKVNGVELTVMIWVSLRTTLDAPPSVDSAFLLEPERDELDRTTGRD